MKTRCKRCNKPLASSYIHLHKCLLGDQITKTTWRYVSANGTVFGPRMTEYEAKANLPAMLEHWSGLRVEPIKEVVEVKPRLQTVKGRVVGDRCGKR